MRLLSARNLVAAAAIGAGAFTFAGPAGAVALTAGSGWQSDTVDSAGVNSLNSPITFTVAPGATDVFSLTDALGLKDVYTVTINGGVTAMSTVTAYPTSFDNTLGPAAAKAGPAWTDSGTSHLQLDFAPGTYSLAIASNCASGACPTTFGDRLDALTAIPEPATWAVMLVGFGGIGSAIRRRRSAGTLAATA
jgi:hypothetical protein